MKNNAKYLFLIILAFYSLNLPSYFNSIDSVSYALAVTEFRPGFLDGKPLYIFACRLFYELLKPGFASRAELVYLFGLFSALFGSLTVVVIYLLHRELFGDSWFSLVSALLVAVTPFFFFVSTNSEVVTFNLFFVSLSVLFWIKRRFLLWGVSWGLALSSHATSFLLFFTFLYLFLRGRQLLPVKQIVCGFILAAVIASASYLWVLSYYESLEVFARTYSALSVNEYVSVGSIYFFTFIFHFITSSGIVISLTAAYSAYYLLKHKRKKEQVHILLSWLAPYTLFLFVWYRDPTMYTLLSLPLALLSWKYFDLAAGDSAKILFTLILVYLVFSDVYFLSPFFMKHNESSFRYISEASIHITDQVRAHHIVYAGTDGLWIRYYHPELDVRILIFQNKEDFVEEISQQASDKRKIYLTEILVAQYGGYQQDGLYVQLTEKLSGKQGIKRINDYLHVLE